MNNDRPILTLAPLVREWLARISQIDADLRGMTEERDTLIRKVEAAKVLMGGIPEEEGLSVESALEEPQKAAQDGHDDSWPSAVLSAVADLGGCPKPALIRRWITKNNPIMAAKLEASPAYFYTVLMRLVRGGRLAKRGKGYRLPTSSPRGETGARDPGSQ